MQQPDLSPAEDSAMAALLGSFGCDAPEGEYCGGCVALLWDLVRASRDSGRLRSMRDFTMHELFREFDRALADHDDFNQVPDEVVNAVETIAQYLAKTEEEA